MLSDVKQFGVLTKAANNRESQERQIATEKRREEKERNS